MVGEAWPFAITPDTCAGPNGCRAAGGISRDSVIQLALSHPVPAVVTPVGVVLRVSPRPWLGIKPDTMLASTQAANSAMPTQEVQGLEAGKAAK